MNGIQIYVMQRKSDRQWTFRVFARNGKKIGWAGEFYHNKAAVIRIVNRLFGDRHQVFVSPAPRGKSEARR